MRIRIHVHIKVMYRQDIGDVRRTHTTLACIYMYVCLYIYVCVCVYIYIYRHICT